MRGLFILLFFQTLGEIGSRFLGLPLPGPVLGMLLLLVALCLWKSVPEDVQNSSNTLIANLGLLLVPAATGFGYYLVTIREQIIPIAVASSVGTAFAIVFTALLMNRLLRDEEKDCD